MEMEEQVRNSGASEESKEDRRQIIQKPSPSSSFPVPTKVFPIFQKNFKPEVNPLKDIQLAFSESVKASAAKRPRRSLLGKTETPGLTQLVLDAGQKQIGPRICKDCGLLYSPGDFQDEEEHRKAHNRLENLFTITLWKDVRILHTFVDGGLVIMVKLNSDPKTVLRRLKDFIAWVDSELGAIVEPTGSGPSQQMFIYILPTKRKNAVRILGSAVMEVADPKTVAAYRLQPPIQKSEEGKEADTGPLKADDAEVSIKVGITRLWTDVNFRKKQIASRICDMIRFHSGIPGCIVTKEELGILEPSDSGKAFMYRYTEGRGALYTYKSESEPPPP